MRIPSGKTDVKIYFLALDATDYVTAETGLSSFTVVRSRNGGADVTYTTPTIAEIDATTMPGLYALTVDEDTTIESTSDSEEYALRITHAGMAPVNRILELYRRDTTSGQTLTVTSGLASANATQISGDGTAADTLELFAEALDQATGQLDSGSLAAGTITAGSIAGDAITAAKVAADVTTELQNGLATAAALATAQADLDILTGTDGATLATSQPNYAPATAAALATVDGIVDSILEDTGTTLPATLTTIAGYIDTEIATLQTSVDDLPTNAELATALGTADDATLAAIAALSIPTANANADALLDRADAIETGLTLRGAMRLQSAALAGKVSGAQTTTEVFRNAVADSKARLTFTVDADGNRSNVATDAS